MMQIVFTWLQGVLILSVGVGLGSFLVYLYYNLSLSNTSSGIHDIKGVSFFEVSISERELEDLLREVETWDLKRLERFLSSFLLENEIRVLRSLANAFIVDDEPNYSHLSGTSKGWLNKHKVHLRSGVSKKSIYRKGGIMQRLTTLGIVLDKYSGSWGSKNKYRLNTKNDFILVYAKAVLDSHPL
ncbi:MAG: hypothetical protein RTV31_02530 [Candidatus Thorarchaeota archaeon]